MKRCSERMCLETPLSPYLFIFLQGMLALSDPIQPRCKKRHSSMPAGTRTEYQTHLVRFVSDVEIMRFKLQLGVLRGFQLIFVPKPGSNKQVQTPGSAGNIPVSGISSLVMSRPRDIEPTEEYLLSIGRVFHKISLSGSEITVTRYRPRHPYPPFNIHYRYRFHAPHHGTYEMSWVSFTTEKLENFNWNYLDHYICTRGDTDFQLAEQYLNPQLCLEL
uniref:Uncharacterized protein n=1 Tax=Timema shepardi TaxID=629360 RepID=A0A7R9AK86_TIMSH|nr:unnamed protein product [Timema shepardi]